MSGNTYLDLLNGDAGETGTPGPAASGNPYADFLEQDDETRLRANLIGAARGNPDQAAQAVKLGRQQGVPTDTALRNPQEVKYRQDLDWALGVIRDDPIISSKLREDLDFARQAVDDVGQLKRVGAEIRAARGVKPTVRSIWKDLAAAPGRVLDLTRESGRQQIGDFLEYIGLPVFDNQDRQFAARRTAQLRADDALSNPEFESTTGAAIYGGVRSTVQQATGVGLSLLMRNPAPALISAGVQTEADAYLKYRERGATPGQAFLGATGEGAVEVATEYLPAEFLVKKLGRVGFGNFVAGMLAREIPSEQVATFLQDAIDTAVANPDKTWEQFLTERPGAAYQTLVSTVTQSALMGGIPAALARVAGHGRQIDQAEEHADGIDRILASSTESKLRERNPEAFAELAQRYAEASDSAPAEVYIDRSALLDVLQQGGLPAEQLEQVMPTVAAQLAKPDASGGLVTIPIGELVAGVPGTTLEQAFADNIRKTPDALTRLEAKDARDQADVYLQQEAERVMQQADRAEASRAGAEAVKQTVLEQLAAAKRFRPEVNDAYATLVRDFYTAAAGRLNVTPEALYQRYPLRIGVEDITEPGKVLQQQAPKLEDVRQAWAAAGVDGSISERNGVITLSKIVVPKELRNGGRGTEAMQQLVQYADVTGQAIAGTASSDFGGSKSRLTAFYKRFGFVENKGRNRAFSVSESMYRPATGKVLEQATRGTFNPATLEISLLANADLSTFLHETGHFFLEALADMSAQPDAPAEVQQDMAKVLDWFGIKADKDTGATPQQVWQAMTLEQKRPYHERWAESFEQYLFEGKAPSVELRPVFARFKAWMTQVYRSLSEFMRGRGLALSDEVRGVFDRLIASEDQIAEAERVARFEAVFKTAEDAGMSPAEWERYQAQNEAATQTAIDSMQARSLRDMRWVAQARSKELKRLQKDVAAKRAAMAEQVTAEVDQLPIMRARAFLASITEPTDAERDASKDWRDRRAAAQERLAAEVKAEFLAKPEAQVLKGIKKGQFIAKNKRLMSNEAERRLIAWEQENPRPRRQPADFEMQAVAETFGYASAADLERALADESSRADYIEALTDQRMLETYGDLTTPQGVERAANEAIHNEARARFVATELATMAKAMGQTERTQRGGSVNVLVRAAKNFAEDLVGRRQIRELRPGAHTAAEARAAKTAAEAMAAGKTADAVAAKRDQLLNHYAARYTSDAQDDVKRALEYLRKFDTEAIRKKLTPDYLDQIDKLLERFDLRSSVTNRELDKRASLLAWVQAQQELGLDPVVPEELLDEARRTSYKNMTVAEFRDLVDAVKNIEHLGRLKHKLLAAKDQREFAAIVDEVATSIRENATTAREERIEAPTARDRALDMVRDFFSSHRKVASIVRQLDGFKDNGAFWRVFSRTMNEAGDAEAVANQRATQALSALFEPLLKSGKLGERVQVPGINRALSLETRLAVALNWGNDANRQRVMDGDRWSAQQVQAILSTLTPQQLQFVQQAWDYLDSFWPEIKAKEERVSGVAPGKVEASPFTVTTADGTVVNMKGGYYPIKYDPLRSARAEADDAAEVTRQMLQGQYTRATTRRGHTKARVDEVNRAVRKDLGVIFQHVSQVNHDLAWHEWLIDATRLLRAGPIDSAIRETMGPEFNTELKKAVQDIAAGDVPAQNGFERAVNHLRQGATITGLGWNLMTSLMQPLGLTQSMVRIGPKWVGKGLARWVGDAVRMENTTREVYAKSDFMRLRGETMNREINEIRNRVQGKKWSALEGSYFYLIQKGQLIADMPTWLGQYEKSTAEGLDDATAVALADQAVRDAQGAGQTQDLARIQRGGPLMKLFTNFYSFFNTTMNLTAERYRETNFRKPADVGLFAVDMLLLYSVPAVLGSLVKHALTGGDDDELAKKLAADQLNYMLGTLVGLREVSAAISGFNGYSGPAGTRFFNELAKLGKQVQQGEADTAFAKALNNTAGILFHYPAGQINRTVEGLLALWEGDTQNPGALLVGPPKP